MLEANHGYKYGQTQAIHVETKIKVLHFSEEMHGNDLNVCGGVIFKMVYRQGVHVYIVTKP